MKLKKKKKLWICMVCALFCGIGVAGPSIAIGSFPVSAVQADVFSGDCSASQNDHVTWKAVKNQDGADTYTLTISGTGKMKNYGAIDANNIHKNNIVGQPNIKITKAVLEKGVTNVGAYAFAAQDSDLQSIALADTVTQIGEEAFYGCKNLKQISLPANLTSIGSGAFAESGLSTIYFAGSRTKWYLMDLGSMSLPYNASVIFHSSASAPSANGHYGSIMLDTAQYTMAPGNIYDIGLVVRDANGSALSAAQIRQMVSSGQLKVRDSRTGSVVSLTQLSNGNFRVTGKQEGTCYIVYDIGGTHASVRVDVKRGVKAGGSAVRNTSYFTQSVAIPSNPTSPATSTAQKEQQARSVAREIAASIKGKTDLEKVQKAAVVVSRYCNDAQYTMSGKDYATAYGVFVKGEYSCAGSTRALGMVLEYMGYRWEHVNPNQYTHQWCKLTMDGKQGFADGMAGFAGYGQHPASS